MEILILVPLIFGAWLANYGEERSSMRMLMLILLGLINALLLIMGLLVIVAGQLQPQSADVLPPNVPQFDFGTIGLALLLTGGAGFVPLIPPVRRLLARLIPIDPRSLVHVMALVYAVYLMGNTLATWPIVDTLAENESFAEEALGQFGVLDLWAQGLFFAALAVVGVGFLSRRDWRSTLQRLKVGRLSVRQVALSGAALIVLLAIEVGISQVWHVLDPASYEEVGGLADTFIRSFLSPVGALTVGLSAGIGEELLFRGALQPRFGILFTTLLFTFAHAQYSLSPALIGIFVVGYGLGVLRNRFNTTAAILVHAGFNFLQVIVATYVGT